MVDRTYHTVDFTYDNGTSGSNYHGPMCKQIVANLVALCPELSLSSVLVDTTSIYSCILSCMNSEFRIFIRNDGTGLYLGVVNSTGTELSTTQRIGVLGLRSDNSSGTTKYYARFRIYHSSIGGFYNRFRIANIMDNNSVDFVYGWAYSKQTAQNFYMFWHTYYNGDKYANTPFNFGDLLTESARVYTAASDSAMPYLEASTPNLYAKYAAQYTGASHVLIPIAVTGYISEPKIWLGPILWGGLYDLFMLITSADSEVGISADSSYAINGGLYQGCFTRMIIPEPSIYL